MACEYFLQFALYFVRRVLMETFCCTTESRAHWAELWSLYRTTLHNLLQFTRGPKCPSCFPQQHIKKMGNLQVLLLHKDHIFKNNLFNMIFYDCLLIYWILFWSNAVNLNWKDSPISVLDVHQELISSGLRVWIFRFLIFWNFKKVKKCHQFCF